MCSIWENYPFSKNIAYSLSNDWFREQVLVLARASFVYFFLHVLFTCFQHVYYYCTGTIQRYVCGMHKNKQDRWHKHNNNPTTQQTQTTDNIIKQNEEYCYTTQIEERKRERERQKRKSTTNGDGGKRKMKTKYDIVDFLFWLVDCFGVLVVGST